MNMYDIELMSATTIRGDRCIVCGRPASENHHLVYRSHGGKDGPTVPLCGFGNTSGCHGAVHANRLHFRYMNGQLEYLLTDEPVKVDAARSMSGWRVCGRTF